MAKDFIALEPTITRDMMMRADELENEGFKSFKASTKLGTQIQVLLAGKCPDDSSDYKFYQSLTKGKWSTFDEYITHGYQMFWLVKFVNESWKVNSSCTCPVYFKERICKHILAIELREKLMICPQDTNPILLVPRRKPGRSKNATKVLMRD